MLQAAQVLWNASPTPLHGHGFSWHRGCWPHTSHGARKVSKALLLKGVLVPSSNGNDGNKALPGPHPGAELPSASRQRPRAEFVMSSLLEGTGTWRRLACGGDIFLPLQKSGGSTMTQPQPWD